MMDVDNATLVGGIKMSPKVEDFVQIMARVSGKSMSDLASDLLAQYVEILLKEMKVVDIHHRVDV